MSRYFRMLATLAVIIVSTAGCNKKNNADAARSLALKPKVKVETAAFSRMVETMAFTGILAGWQEANLAPTMPGRVEKILVKEGDAVKAGDVLAEMDKSQLLTIQAQYDIMSATYERMKKLRESNAVSQTQFEETESAFKQAEVGLNSAKANTQIRAPFDGVVTAVTKQPGEIYSGMGGAPGGASGLIQVADLSRMKMDIMVGEDAVIKLQKGQRTELHMDVYPDSVFQGRIDWINPAADPMTRTFNVRVEVPNNRRLLRPGFYGKAVVTLREKAQALSMVESAVVDNRYLFVATDKGKAERREVTIGIMNETRIEIEKGLNAGDRVIVSGNRGLSDGVDIEIVK